METRTLKVEGMDCDGCENSIQKALARLDGVEASKASFATGLVEVTFDPARVAEDDLAAAIADAGYDLVR